MSTTAAAPKAPARKFEANTDLTNLFKLLCEAPRLAVVAILSGGERNVTDLCREYGCTQPSMSHHLTLLRVGGVVRSRREGKHNFYHLTELGSAAAKFCAAVSKEK